MSRGRGGGGGGGGVAGLRSSRVWERQESSATPRPLGKSASRLSILSMAIVLVPKAWMAVAAARSTVRVGFSVLRGVELLAFCFSRRSMGRCQRRFRASELYSTARRKRLLRDRNRLRNAFAANLSAEPGCWPLPARVPLRRIMPNRGPASRQSAPAAAPGNFSLQSSIYRLDGVVQGSAALATRSDQLAKLHFASASQSIVQRGQRRNTLAAEIRRSFIRHGIARPKLKAISPTVVRPERPRNI